MTEKTYKSFQFFRFAYRRKKKNYDGARNCDNHKFKNKE